MVARQGQGYVYQAILAAIASLLVHLTGTTTQATFVSETVELPVEVADATGRTIQQTITLVVFRDGRRAKSPFLILNHGRSGDPAKRQALTPSPFVGNAHYLVEKGFAVFFPIR